MPFRLKLLSIGIFTAALIALALPTTVSIAFIATTVLVVLILLNEHSEWSIAHPFAFLSLSLLLGVVGTFYDFVILDARESSWLLLDQGRGILIPGGATVLAGIGALVYGYATSWGHQLGAQLPPFSSRWNRSKAIQVAWTYAFIGLLAFGYIIASIDLNDISAKRQFATVYIRWLVQFLFFAGLITIITILNHDESFFSLVGFGAAAVVGLYFVFGIVVSSRTAILWNSILLLALYVQFRRIRFEKLAGLGVLFIGIASGMLALRSDADSLLSYLDPWSLVESVFGANRGGVTALSHLISQTPHEIPFQYGRTLIQWIVFPIPRALWPGKPETIGEQLAWIIYGAPNGTSPRLAGDLYWNFGIVGVVVGFFLVGVVLRTLVKYRARANHSPSVVLLSTVTLFMAARLPDISKLMINLGLWLVPLSAAVIVSTTADRTPEERAQHAPDLISSSRVVQALFSASLLGQKLRIGWRCSATRQLGNKIGNRFRQAAESSRVVTILRRLDQSP